MRTSLQDYGYLPAVACSLDRPVLRDEALGRTLRDRGWVVVPLLESDDVAQLVHFYDSAAAGGINPDGAYNDTYAEFSVIHSHPAFRREAFDRITEVLVPHVDDHLVDHRPLIANFVNKPPGTGVVPTHQNFAVVDEARFRSLSVWVALVDCTVANGAMSMLDGSHRTLRGSRGMWAYEAFGMVDEHYIDRHFQAVEVPAGHAVILDDALVHYSPPNLTDERRLAIQLVMVPTEAQARWYHRAAADPDTMQVDVLAVEPPFFFDFWHGDGDLAHATLVERQTVPTPIADPASARALLDAAVSGGPVAVAVDVAAEPGGPAPVAMAPQPAPMPLPIGGPLRRTWDRLRRRRPARSSSLRRTFRSDELEAELARVGYVVVPLLSPEAVSEALEAYEALDHHQHGDNPFAPGFHTSIYDDRIGYRTSVNEIIQATVGTALDEVLDDHQIVLANFAVKLPGGEPVPCHPDWTFVDEERCRSVTVWCALADVDAGGGALGVVAGSSGEVDFIRPLNIRSYERYDDIADRRGRGAPISLRAGEAIVMDSRSLHYSSSNLTERPRVVAACVAVPAEVALSHYFVEPDGAVRRHDVEPAFYLHYAPGSDPDQVVGAGPRSAVSGVDVG